uniref:Sec-independent protein translocase protein TatA n=1 Tax=Salix viminalis TaxID=40686 RepID=A0A6N2LZT7_SALVM
MIMEISSITLSLPKSPCSIPVSSSHSTFFNSSAFFKKTKSCNSLVIGKTSRSQRATKGLTCNALFGLGVPELAVIAGVAALVFGPKKLPEVGKSIGKTVKSFQQAAKEFESELKKEPDSESETPGEQPKKTISEVKKQDVEVSSSKESI